jgi:hypothetical protein
MSIQLNIDNMLDVLSDLDHPEFSGFVACIEAIASAMALKIAEKLDCATDNATFQGSDFAGTCAPFRPKTAGQPFPEVFQNYDDPSEWEEDCKDIEEQKP